MGDSVVILKTTQLLLQYSHWRKRLETAKTDHLTLFSGVTLPPNLGTSRFDRVNKEVHQQHLDRTESHWKEVTAESCCGIERSFERGTMLIQKCTTSARTLWA